MKRAAKEEQVAPMSHISLHVILLNSLLIKTHVLPVSTGVSGNLKDKSARACKASKEVSSPTQKELKKRGKKLIPDTT